MKIIAVANILAVVTAVWAVWECRLSFRSRWDAPKTSAIILFGLGAALDSPWPAVAAASHPLFGRYFFFTVIGHICYLAGSAFGIRFLYSRLLPDSEIGPFMRMRLAPVVVLSAVVMVVAFFSSPLTASITADYLYLVHPDEWLTVYWLTYYSALAVLLLVAIYGVNRLRTDPRSVMLNLLLAALALGVLSCVASGVGVATGQNGGIPLVAWPVAYVAIAAGSVAVALAWRHRVRQMVRPAGE